MQLQYGSYVVYKGRPYIAVKNNGKGKVTILDVESNQKLTVKTSNIKLYDKTCKTKVHEGTTYLITLGKEPLIISSKTHRVMQWKATHPTRLAILGKSPRF